MYGVVYVNTCCSWQHCFAPARAQDPGSNTQRGTDMGMHTGVVLRMKTRSFEMAMDSFWTESSPHHRTTRIFALTFCIQEKAVEGYGNYQNVLIRWLKDINLAKYKDAFLEKIMAPSDFMLVREMGRWRHNCKCGRAECVAISRHVYASRVKCNLSTSKHYCPNAYTKNGSGVQTLPHTRWVWVCARHVQEQTWSSLFCHNLRLIFALPRLIYRQPVCVCQMTTMITVHGQRFIENENDKIRNQTVQRQGVRWDQVEPSSPRRRPANNPKKLCVTARLQWHVFWITELECRPCEHLTSFACLYVCYEREYAFNSSIFIWSIHLCAHRLTYTCWSTDLLNSLCWYQITNPHISLHVSVYEQRQRMPKQPPSSTKHKRSASGPNNLKRSFSFGFTSSSMPILEAPAIFRSRSMAVLSVSEVRVDVFRMYSLIATLNWIDILHRSSFSLWVRCERSDAVLSLCHGCLALRNERATKEWNRSGSVTTQSPIATRKRCRAYWW